MNNIIQKVVSQIVIKINDKDFIEFVESKVGKLEEIDRRGESVESFLRLIENNPKTDFGMPGPLVHFLEKYYKNGYENKLVESVRRQPVPHNVWMLNRIINGSKGDSKVFYINELDKVLIRSDVSLETREVAAELRGGHDL
jgi:hypothetical protein